MTTSSADLDATGCCSDGLGFCVSPVRAPRDDKRIQSESCGGIGSATVVVTFPCNALVGSKMHERRDCDQIISSATGCANLLWG